MSHRIATSIVGGLIFVLFIVLLAIAAPAKAATQLPRPHWRQGTTVCVDLPSAFVTKRWNLRQEISRWNGLPRGPRLVARERCSRYLNTVKVRVQYNYQRAYQAITYQDYDWQTGIMKHVNIFLNPYGISSRPRTDPRSCLRAWAAGHEFGHAVGLDHHTWAYDGNIMAYQGWWRRCGSFGPDDIRQYNRIYNRIYNR